MSLVVVNADAGYGKTTLVASYLAARARQAIWYHLSVTDRLLGTLVAHLRHAVAELFPEVTAMGTDPLEVLHDPEFAGAALAALLGRSGMPLTVVLEDYHRASEDSGIHQLVLAMVEHLPPNVQVMLLSRSRPALPLARLTMTRRVRELTKQDLAFRLEETAALFARIYGQYLSEEQFTLVSDRLEGWAVGLQLTAAALRLTLPADRIRFWGRFAESPAHFDYLAQEVLAALPEATLQFLQTTSIFPVLRPDLVEEFLPGCGAAELLRQLARENLFTTALSGAGTHYRYHNLLRAYLRRRLREGLGENGVRQLHARAAEVCLRRNEMELAIGHSLAAADYPRVIGMLERLVGGRQKDVLVRLMEGWLEREFPEVEGFGVPFRRLLPLALYELALPILHQVAAAPAGCVDAVAQTYAQQRLGTYYFYRGRLDESVVWLGRARSAFRTGGNLIQACICSTLIGLAYIYKGTPEQAEEPVAEALALAGESGAVVSSTLFAQAELACSLRRFAEAEQAARAALDHNSRFGLENAFFHGALAYALVGQGRTDEAVAACVQAVACARRSGVKTDLGFAHLRLAMVLRAAGNNKGARVAADKAVGLLAGFDSLLARALLIRADVAAAAGDAAAPQLGAEVREYWADRGYQLQPEHEWLIPPPPRRLHADTGAITAPVAPAAVIQPRLVIRTLGSFRIWIEGRESHPGRWGRTSSRRLFCYLLLNRGRQVHREAMIEALWPGADPGACAYRLGSALSLLRRELAPLSQIIERQGKLYCLELPPDTDLDSDQFAMLASTGLAQGDLASLRRAAGLYQGDFLAEHMYDEFLDAERTRLSQLYHRVVTALGDGARQAGELNEALDWYREAHRLDPLLEEPVRRIMEILLARGEPSAAAESYRGLRRALRRELGLEPSDELRGLYNRAVSRS